MSKAFEEWWTSPIWYSGKTRLPDVKDCVKAAWDYQQVKITELEKSVEYWKADSAAAWDKCEERRKENEELRRLVITRIERARNPKYSVSEIIEADTALRAFLKRN